MNNIIVLKKFIKELILEQLSRKDTEYVDLIVNLIKKNKPDFLEQMSEEDMRRDLSSNIHKYDSSIKQWVLKYLKEQVSTEGISYKELFFKILDSFVDTKKSLKEKNILAINPKTKELVYKTVADLRYEIDKFAQMSSLMMNQKPKYKKIYENERLTIYFPENVMGSVKLGANTKWCISAKKDNMFDYYTTKGNNFIYFVFDKKNDSMENPFYKIALGYSEDEGITYENDGTVVDAMDQVITEDDIINYYGRENYNIIVEQLARSSYKIGFHPNFMEYQNLLNVAETSSIKEVQMEVFNYLKDNSGFSSDEALFFLRNPNLDDGLASIIIDNTSNYSDQIINLIHDKYKNNSVILFKLFNKMNFEDINKYIRIFLDVPDLNFIFLPVLNQFGSRAKYGTYYSSKIMDTIYYYFSPRFNDLPYATFEYLIRISLSYFKMQYFINANINNDKINNYIYTTLVHVPIPKENVIFYSNIFFKEFNLSQEIQDKIVDLFDLNINYENNKNSFILNMLENPSITNETINKLKNKVIENLKKDKYDFSTVLGKNLIKLGHMSQDELERFSANE
jgi:hypothetical protein